MNHLGRNMNKAKGTEANVWLCSQETGWDICISFQGTEGKVPAWLLIPASANAHPGRQQMNSQQVESLL